MFILMITTNLKLTLLALIPFPLVIFIVYKSMDFFFQTYQRIQEKFSDITAKAQENISGVRVVKAYVQEEHEIKQFINLNQSYLKENLKLARARGLLSASVEVLFGLAFIGSQFFGKKPLVERMMGASLELPAAIWKRLNLMWATFFISVGFLNIYVMQNFNTDDWVSFKTFGVPGLMIIFIILQMVFIYKYIPDTEE